MLCHPEPHPAVNYALRNVKSPITVSRLAWDLVVPTECDAIVKHGASLRGSSRFRVR